MVTFHYIEFQTHCHATESLDKVKRVVENLAGQEMEFEMEDAEGYYGNPIKIITCKIDRNREMDEFFESLPRKLIEELHQQIEKRIDDRCNFFFRIDKGKAYEDEPVLTEGGNSIRIRARVESYPSKKETAVKKMQDYLSDISS
ncbi:MAG: RNA-binding domain-containing protein [Thermoplasmata archaeon]